MPEDEASSALDIRARMFLLDRRNASASGASMKWQTSCPQGPIVPVTIRWTVRLGSTNAIGGPLLALHGTPRYHKIPEASDMERHFRWSIPLIEFRLSRKA
jgi:hypothetical protein